MRIARTDGVHGPLGPSPGFVLAADGEPTLYVAGDTIWCDEVRAALDEHAPDVVAVNASGAHFLGGDPLVMTTDDVVAVGPPRAGAPASSPSTSRRSTTASRRGPTCTSACARSG